MLCSLAYACITRVNQAIDLIDIFDLTMHALAKQC